jgi:DNA repair protein RadC
MKRLALSTSEEDCSASPPRIHTVDQAIRWAGTVINAPDQEWFLALFLNRCDELLGIQEFYRGHTCIRVAETYTRAMVNAAIAHHAAMIIMLRHHDHAWRPRDGGDQRLRTIKRYAAAAGVPIRLHVIMDSTGLILPLLLHQSEASGSGLIGALGGTSVPC